MPGLPARSVVQVPRPHAEALAAAAGRAPIYDAPALYDPRHQQAIRDAVREHAGQAYDEAIAAARECLAKPPYLAILRGLALDPEDRAFVALSAAFGTLVASPYRPPRTQIVYRIQARTDLPGDGRTRTESEWLHTDSADWPEPVDVLVMACVRPCPDGGGKTRVLTAEGLRDALAARLGPQGVRRAEQVAVPWALSASGGGGVVHRPILDGPHVRWRRSLIDAALRARPTPEAAETLGWIEAVHAAIEDATQTIELSLVAGDLLLADNRRTVHARTSLPGSYEGSPRLMLRAWVRAAAS